MYVAYHSPGIEDVCGLLYTSYFSYDEDCKKTKTSIYIDNFFEIESKLKDGIDFLKSLKVTSGLPLMQGARKSFAVGFYFCLLLLLVKISCKGQTHPLSIS